MSVDTVSSLDAVILQGMHLAAACKPGLGSSSAVVQGGANDVAVQVDTAILCLLHQFAQVIHCSKQNAFSLAGAVMPCISLPNSRVGSQEDSSSCTCPAAKL